MSHLYDNRHYVIFDCTELSTIDFSQVYETSEATVRKSVDESQALIKYEYFTYTDQSGSLYETIPSSVEALTTKSSPYSYEEIIPILSTSVWNNPSPNN
tara:strand:- start:239 stop:535 length:297 start_codon:yes stop_codon:yes gene_type:complete